MSSAEGFKIPLDTASKSLFEIKRRKIVKEEFAENECNSVPYQLHELPDEILERILDYVQAPPNSQNPKAKGAVRVVCRRWHRIASSQLNYQGVLNDATIQSFVHISPALKLKHLVISGLSDNRVRHCEPLSEQDNELGGKDYDPCLFEKCVEHLIIGGTAKTGIFLKKNEKDENLPYSLSTGYAEDHKMLVAIPLSESSPSCEELINILPGLQGVNTLTLSSSAFLSVKLEDMCKLNFSQYFSTLTTLDICIGSQSDESKLVAFFGEATFPTLSSLYIRIYISLYHFSLLISIYRFISRHRCLKNLSLSQAQAIYGIPNSDYQHLAVNAFPGFVENLMNVKLECLRIDCMIVGQDIGEQWKNLELAFIRNQTNLKGLELQINIRTVGCRLDEILPPCGKTLERLELTSVNVSPNYFDCSALSNYTKLKDCHLYPRSEPYFRVDDNSEYVRIANIRLLPQSIENLHLGRMPNTKELLSMKDQLVNLKRLSYNCVDLINITMSPILFLYILMEHLRLPSLVEFRMYQYACPTVVNFLNGKHGLICYTEDEESVVVLVDKDEFDLEIFFTIANSVSDCTCKYCQ